MFIDFVINNFRKEIEPKQKHAKGGDKTTRASGGKVHTDAHLERRNMHSSNEIKLIKVSEFRVDEKERVSGEKKFAGRRHRRRTINLPKLLAKS